MIRKIAALSTAVIMLQCMALGQLQAESTSAGPRVEIGPFVSRIIYEEPGTMKESGTMYGLDGSLSWHGQQYLGLFNTFRIDALASRGSLDYTSPNAGAISGIENTMFETRALLGRDFTLSGQSELSSYIGFGYRSLSDKTGGLITTAGYYGYDRHSQYLYLPIGLGVVSQMQKGWSFDGLVEYDLFLKGIQKSNITDANNAVYTYSNDVTNDQFDGYGLRASVKFTRRLERFGSVAFEPFLRYWNIGASRTASFIRTDGTGSHTAIAWEPANHSTEYGLKVSLVF
jgi:hypothetical protein